MADENEESKDWTPKQHIDRACHLADRAEGAYGECKEWLATMAQAHIQIAFAKSELRDE